MTEFIIRQERFIDFWIEAEPLAKAHRVEVNDGDRPHHPFKMNIRLIDMIERAGAFRVFAARIDGRLAGYITWSITPDVESDGVMLADQGGWYVAPWVQETSEGRRLQVGKQLIKYSIDKMKLYGIDILHFHHQLNGRGKNAGAMFRRMGAVIHQHRYTLWIGS